MKYVSIRPNKMYKMFKVKIRADILNVCSFELDLFCDTLNTVKVKNQKIIKERL